MNIRPLNESDRDKLTESLSKDEFHKSTTTVDFFYDPKSVSHMYEDEQGPIFVVRCAKTMRLDIQFISNADFKRNRQGLIDGFAPFVELCKANGYSELIFNSESPLLIAFCKKYFGFIESHGELRRYI